MANNFYQTSNKILKLNSYNKRDLELIQFNHYISRKENLQRSTGELARGLFKLSYSTIETDTGLSRNKIQRIIKWFEDNKIIECIHKSKARNKESIYAYTSVYYEKNSTVFNTVFNTNLSSNYNGLSLVSNTVFNTNNSTSKKEKEKENIKSIKEKEYKKELHYKSEGYEYSDMINSYTKNPYMVRALEKYIDMRNRLSKKDNKEFTQRGFKMALSQLYIGKYNDNDRIKRIYKTISQKSKSIVYVDELTRNENIEFQYFIKNIENEIKKANTQNVKAKRENLI